jgi:hypothetical protein
MGPTAMIDAEPATSALPRPAPREYHEYYGRYIDLVPDGNIAVTLKEQLSDTLRLLGEVPPERETHRYDEGKWSLREVVGHLIDVERTFEFRALAMARQDAVDLPGMDQEVWAARSAANERPLADLLEEWKAVRRGAVHLFATFDRETGARTGRASGKSFTVRCFPWIIAGHELWHRGIIRERYLKV